MRLLRIRVIAAETCGGLLDDLVLGLRGAIGNEGPFEPLCLIGPNGTGKSQLLQVVAEMFQSAFHAVVPHEERIEGNADLQFELEYLTRPVGTRRNIHVRIDRQADGKHKPALAIQKRVDGQWVDCDLSSPSTQLLLPSKIVGYTSGDNETLSLPFLLSRSGYADEVGRRALNETRATQTLPDTRLMLIDYGTHLEVLVANLLLGTNPQRETLVGAARLSELYSFRCIVQLAHSRVRKTLVRRASTSKRKGIQLTAELEGYIDRLRRCSTCYDYDEDTETYKFDFLVDRQTKNAFRFFWNSTIDLYSAFHKLAMLNDLAIPKASRERFRKETKMRRFATRLPEPQDEDKVFRFERVNFVGEPNGEIVDYVSLSDGEHQLAQILGTFCMVSDPEVLFLLDEPESHFNPQWRVKFISRLLDLPTRGGARREISEAARQDCLLTTHAPFLPSDMSRNKVFIFNKDNDGKVTVRCPDIETYGTTFDTVLEECFGVRPPISEVPRRQIKKLMKSKDAKKIQAGIEKLGHSVEKAFLADHLRQVKKRRRA